MPDDRSNYVENLTPFGEDPIRPLLGGKTLWRRYTSDNLARLDHHVIEHIKDDLIEAISRQAWHCGGCEKFKVNVIEEPLHATMETEYRAKGACDFGGGCLMMSKMPESISSPAEHDIDSFEVIEVEQVPARYKKYKEAQRQYMAGMDHYRSDINPAVVEKERIEREARIAAQKALYERVRKEMEERELQEIVKTSNESYGSW